VNFFKGDQIAFCHNNIYCSYDYVKEFVRRYQDVTDSYSANCF